MFGFPTRSHLELVSSTEVGTASEVLPNEMSKEWEWFKFSPAMKPHLIPDGYGAYELVVEVRCCSIHRHVVVFGWIADMRTSSPRRLTGSASTTPR